MISFIKGTVVDIEESKIILECNGIGYNIFVPSSLVNSIGKTGKDVKVFTYLAVREDSMTLFGFLLKEELDIFKQIIGVSGIGPKGALGILSTLTIDELKIAIMADDSKTIAKAPGIGGKTASKLILELRDKIDFDNPFGISGDMAGETDYNSDSGVQNDAMDALIALGYSSSQALSAIKKAYASNKDIGNTSELIKIALKNI